MDKKLKGGILGAGENSFIGYVHIAAASLDRDAEIVAGVFSGNPEKSIARGAELNIKIGRSYPDYKVMVEKELSLPVEERIDFVIVATPNSSHYDISLAFLKAGIHVFSDKPMAISLKQAIKCIENNEKPCNRGKPGWEYPDSDQGVLGLAFIEAIIKNNKSSKKWTTLRF